MIKEGGGNLMGDYKSGYSFTRQNRVRILLTLFLITAPCKGIAQGVQINCESHAKNGLLIEARELIKNDSDSVKNYITRNSEVLYYFLENFLFNENVEQKIIDQITKYNDSVLVLTPSNAAFLLNENCNVSKNDIETIYSIAFKKTDFFLVKNESHSYAVNLKQVSALFNTVRMEKSRRNHREFVSNGYAFDELGNRSEINVLSLRSINQFENVDSIALKKGLKKIRISP